MNDYKTWGTEKLLRKIEQEGEMASLAFCDGDKKDGFRRLKLTELYQDEVRSR